MLIHNFWGQKSTFVFALFGDRESYFEFCSKNLLFPKPLFDAKSHLRSRTNYISAAYHKSAKYLTSCLSSVKGLHTFKNIGPKFEIRERVGV